MSDKLDNKILEELKCIRESQKYLADRLGPVLKYRAQGASHIVSDYFMHVNHPWMCPGEITTKFDTCYGHELAAKMALESDDMFRQTKMRIALEEQRKQNKEQAETIDRLRDDIGKMTGFGKPIHFKETWTHLGNVIMAEEAARLSKEVEALEAERKAKEEMELAEKWNALCETGNRVGLYIHKLPWNVMRVWEKKTRRFRRDFDMDQKCLEECVRFVNQFECGQTSEPKPAPTEFEKLKTRGYALGLVVASVVGTYYTVYDHGNMVFQGRNEHSIKNFLDGYEAGRGK